MHVINGSYLTGVVVMWAIAHLTTSVPWMETSVHLCLARLG